VLVVVRAGAAADDPLAAGEAEFEADPKCSCSTTTRQLTA
jgi:hypothetical protein